jgi:catechol 2,3-dioxygenase-like lactoylglutathione lyase family enzyme
MPDVIPVLPATDIDRAAHFYGMLGFVEDTRTPDYLIVVHPLGVELHLHLEGRWGVGGSNHSGAAYIRFAAADDARGLHRAWARSTSISELHETHYGQLEFTLVDPFGNTITVGGATA